MAQQVAQVPVHTFSLLAVWVGALLLRVFPLSEAAVATAAMGHVVVARFRRVAYPGPVGVAVWATLLGAPTEAVALDPVEDRAQLARLVFFQMRAKTGVLVFTVFVGAVARAMALGHPVAGTAAMRLTGDMLQAQARRQILDLVVGVDALLVLA